jgi:hypothetical protein
LEAEKAKALEAEKAKALEAEKAKALEAEKAKALEAEKAKALEAEKAKETPEERVSIAVDTFLASLKRADAKAVGEQLAEVSLCAHVAQSKRAPCAERIQLFSAAVKTAWPKLLAAVAVPLSVEPIERLVGDHDWVPLVVWKAKIQSPIKSVAIELLVIELPDDSLRLVSVEVPSFNAPTKALNTAGGFQRYTRGDFSAAAGFFLRASRDKTLSAKATGRARTYAQLIKRFASASQAGMSAVSSGQPSVAIRQLKKALKADRRVNRSYQRRLKGVLGGLYAKVATRAMRSNRRFEAAKAARDSLRMTPGNAEAKQVMVSVRNAIEPMINRGIAARDAGRISRAKRILKEVLLVIKTLGKSDPRKARVKALLKEL